MIWRRSVGLTASRLRLEAEPVETDESRRIILIVGVLGPAFHRGNLFVVKAVGGSAPCGDDVAFVELQTHFAGDISLGVCHEGLEGFALGSEPEAVVDELGVFGDEGVTQVHDFAIHREAFHLAMGGEEDGSAGGLVDSAALHPDKTVLHHVDAPDSVATTEQVEDTHDAVGIQEGISVDLTLLLHISELAQETLKTVHFQTDAVSFFEEQLHVFGFIGSFFGGDAEDIHVSIVFTRGVVPRVFEDSALETDVEKVPVHAVGLFDGGLHGDVVLGGVGDHFSPAGEFLAKTLLTPRGDDLDTGGEGGGGEFKTNLVVPFTCRSVGDGIGSVFNRGADHAFGNAGAGDGGAEEVLPFIDGTGLDHGEDEIFGEGVFEISDDAFGGTGLESFFFEPVEFFLLPDVGTVGDHFGLIGVFQPSEKDGGVETTGVGHQYFFDRIAHEKEGGYHISRAHLTCRISACNGIWQSLFCLYGSGAQRKEGPADEAEGAVATASGAMLSPVENDLKVEFVPGLTGEGALQGFFGFDDVLPGGEFPPLGEAMDVGVDGKCGDAEGLAHDDGSGLVPDAREGFKRCKVGRDFTAIFFHKDAGEFGDGRRLSGGEPARADDGADALDGDLCHRLRMVGEVEQGRGHLIHTQVRALR